MRVMLPRTQRKATCRSVSDVSVLRSSATDQQLRDAERNLRALAAIESPGKAELSALRSSDVVGALAEQTDGADLVILGLPRIKGRKLVGELALRTAQRVRCPTIMLSRRG